MRLQGSSILITGAAKRVGKTVALELAKQGANIAISYNSSQKQALQTVREIASYGVKAKAFRADISIQNDVKKMVAQAKKALGRIDALITNAAVFKRTPFESLTEKDWDFHMDTNLKGTFLCAKAVGDIMLQQGYGKIITIGDWSGIRPYKHYIPYCVSKAGVIALTKALARTLAPHIQVNCVAPGPILLPSDFDEQDKRAIITATPLRRIGSPQDIAATIRFLLEGTDFITGAIIPVDGGRLIA